VNLKVWTLVNQIEKYIFTLFGIFRDHLDAHIEKWPIAAPIFLINKFEMGNSRNVYVWYCFVTLFVSVSIIF
jgi:hypothetical protein